MHGAAVAVALDSIQSVIATILDTYTAIIYCYIIFISYAYYQEYVLVIYTIDVVASDCETLSHCTDHTRQDIQLPNAVAVVEAQDSSVTHKKKYVQRC